LTREVRLEDDGEAEGGEPEDEHVQDDAAHDLVGPEDEADDAVRPCDEDPARGLGDDLAERGEEERGGQPDRGHEQERDEVPVHQGATCPTGRTSRWCASSSAAFARRLRDSNSTTPRPTRT